MTVVAPLPQGWTIRSASEYRQNQWAGGRTTELWINPLDANVAARDFLWRFSTASVEQAGAFSDFSGYERWLGLRQGQGMRLELAEQWVELTSPHHVLRFSGHAKVMAALRNGPIDDVNLMVRVDLPQLELCELCSPQIPPKGLVLARSTPRQWLIWADSSTLHVKANDVSVELSKGQCLHIEKLDMLQLFADSAAGCVVALLPVQASF